MPENDVMTPTTQTPMISELRKVLKRLHYPLEVMQERGVFVDHSTVHRWSLKILPILALILRRRKRPVGASWRLDETYIKVAGQWKYLYRAVDKAGDAVDFMLTAKRDLAAARRYLERAINLHGLPEKITIDKSGANTAAIKIVNADACIDIELRQSKYLNNIVEQDHRAVKRVTDPMLGFKSFWSARKLIAGIETMHMVKKGQLRYPTGQPMSAADQFYSLAF
jgi:putative transposase